MSVHLIREAAEILRDAAGRNPEDVQRVAGELLSMVDGAAVVISLNQREARAVVNSSNLTSGVIESALGETIAELRRINSEEDFPTVSPLASAAMKVELAMVQEGIER